MRAVAVGIAAAFGLGACASRQPATLPPLAPVASSIIWRLEAGDEVATRVFRSPELSTTVTVATNGTAFFPALGRIHVAGLTTDSLEQLLSARYAASVLKDAAVQVAMQRQVTIVGQVRAPGVYTATPLTTILGLVARAGGSSTGGGFSGARASIEVVLIKADGMVQRLPGEARLGALDLHTDDAIQLSDNSFFTRNATSIAATQIIVSTIAALISVIVIVTR